MKGKTKAVSIEGTVYESIAVASVQLGYHPSVITARIRSRSPRFRDWKWAIPSVGPDVRGASKRRVVIFGIIYESTTAAAKALGINLHTLRTRLASQSSTFAEYKYIESDPQRVFHRRKNVAVVVHGKEYPSKVRAAEVLGVTTPAITHMLKHPKRFPGCYYKNLETGEIIYLSSK